MNVIYMHTFHRRHGELPLSAHNGLLSDNGPSVQKF
jgi:hypothetical protein